MVNSELANDLVREGTPADAVDGVVPRTIITPDTATNLAVALAWASREGLPTVIRGGGSKLGWGRPPTRLDLVVSTSRLTRLLAHRHGDLTATIEAGASLRDVRAQLAQHRQWLPIDSAFDAATIGGIVATNDSGPLRHRHGTPRDLLIGITLALTDGRVVKAGGHVVKNVAGYDLGKLVSGSYGTLAAIVDATFKLAPIPAASRTLIARCADADALARNVVTLSASQLEPTMLDLHASIGSSPGYVLYVGFATSPAALAAQASAAADAIQAEVQAVSGADETALWEAQVRRPWTSPGAVVRMSWRPALLPRVLDLLEEIARTTGAAVELTGRAAVGSGFVRLDADDRVQAAAIDKLRSRPDVVGHVVALRASADVKRALDVWGPVNEMGGAPSALKRAFDPAGILNAGRGPV